MDPSPPVIAVLLFGLPVAVGEGPEPLLVPLPVVPPWLARLLWLLWCTLKYTGRMMTRISTKSVPTAIANQTRPREKRAVLGTSGEKGFSESSGFTAGSKVAEWAGVEFSLSTSGPVVLCARESRGEVSPIEGPGPKKDALGGSRGGVSKASKEGGGVACSGLTVDTGRSSAMVGGKRDEEGGGERGEAWGVLTSGALGRLQ